MFAEPPPTQYDLRFSLFGLPVRVHPLFWIIIAFFGMPGDIQDMSFWLQQILCWIAAAFVGILVHELGHALLLSRVFGARTWIVLYGMGGLACHDRYYRRRVPGTLGEIGISAAGPLAGFALIVVVSGILLLCGLNIIPRLDWFANVVPIPSLMIEPAEFFKTFSVLPRQVLILFYLFLADLFFISIFWGLLNLLPIYPLDGGQISRELFLVFNRRSGIVNSLRLSVIVGGAFAAVGLMQWVQIQEMQGFPWIAILFGYLAFQSYQLLSMYHR